MTIAMSTDQVHTRVHTQSPLQLSLVMNCIAVVALFFFFSVIASLPSIPKEDSVALKAIWQHHSHLAPRIALSWRELAPRIAASLTKISFKNLQFLTLLCFLWQITSRQTSFLMARSQILSSPNNKHTFRGTKMRSLSYYEILHSCSWHRERERMPQGFVAFSICSCSLVVVLLHQSCIGIACEKIVAIICAVCSDAWFSTELLQFLTLLCYCDRLRQDKRTFSWRARRSFLLPKTNIPSEI